MQRVFLAFICGLFVLSGCAEADTSSATQQSEKNEIGGKQDRWTDADDPHLFTDTLETKLEALPLAGEAANIPWASSYWPIYEDSINYLWEGEGTLSPAAKYGAAFDIEDIEDKVSSNHGIDSINDAKECTTDDDCSEPGDGKCAIRNGAEAGRCIPTWWGICHAWAPAAIMEPEALYPVTKNGVTFKVNDIKALMTLAYNRTLSKFVSLRCNKNDGQDEISYDGYSRPTSDDAECKDTNPGTYHLLLTNYLGMKGQSFVEDRTFDSEVWNQPLRGYRTTKLEEVSAQRANELVGVLPEGEGVTTYEGIVDANTWAHQDAVAVTAGTQVQAHLRLANKAELYVRFGTQPTDSEYDCKTHNWSSNQSCALEVPEGETELYVSIMGEIVDVDDDEVDPSEESTEFEITVVDATATVPEDYRFNDDAAKLFWVKTEVDYISESASNTDGNLAGDIDRYTHTDHYDYLLELDEDGEVIGGEWLGSSKTDHPDFLWLPTGTSPYAYIAGGAIRMELVRALLNESLVEPVAPPTEETTSGEGTAEEGETDTDTPEVTDTPAAVEHLSVSGSVVADEMFYYELEVPAGRALTVEVNGDHDVDLYLRMNLKPTEMVYDNRGFSVTGNEVLTITSVTGGTLHVGVHGYEASDFTLVTSDSF